MKTFVRSSVSFHKRGWNRQLSLGSAVLKTTPEACIAAALQAGDAPSFKRKMDEATSASHASEWSNESPSLLSALLARTLSDFPECFPSMISLLHNYPHRVQVQPQVDQANLFKLVLTANVKNSTFLDALDLPRIDDGAVPDLFQVCMKHRVLGDALATATIDDALFKSMWRKLNLDTCHVFDKDQAFALKYLLKSSKALHVLNELISINNLNDICEADDSTVDQLDQICKAVFAAGPMYQDSGMLFCIQLASIFYDQDEQLVPLLALINDHYLASKQQDVCDLLLNILEHKRQLCNTKRIQDSFTDEYGVYPVCQALLKKFVLPDGELSQEERSKESRLARLVLFSPDTINIKPFIAELAQRDLLLNSNSHPLALLHSLILDTFKDFRYFGKNISPLVHAERSFDDLLIPKDHPSRSASDSFYFSPTELLRPHTSAHQTEFLNAGHEQFLVGGDVFRRDEIDRTHFPIFHQVEGVKLLPEGSTPQDAFDDLKLNLERLSDNLFGVSRSKQWVDAYFPFTNPSIELEVDFHGKPVEVLGCGVIHQDILTKCNLSNRVGWAFGLGLERLAMLLFDIPDIRLFWSKDPRFLKIFSKCRESYLRTGRHVQFKPFSKYPPSKRELSFWLPESGTPFAENDFFSIVRDTAGDAVEEVELVDTYVSPEGRTSKHYRIVFRSPERTITRQESNAMTSIIAERAAELGLELRS